MQKNKLRKCHLQHLWLLQSHKFLVSDGPFSSFTCFLPRGCSSWLQSDFWFNPNQVRILKAGVTPAFAQLVCVRSRRCLLKLFSHQQSLHRLTLDYFMVVRALDLFLQTWDVIPIFPLPSLWLPTILLFIPFSNAFLGSLYSLIRGTDPCKPLGLHLVHFNCLCHVGQVIWWKPEIPLGDWHSTAGRDGRERASFLQVPASTFDTEVISMSVL